jgi:N-acetylmuramoyl-L-alanine amidase
MKNKIIFLDPGHGRFGNKSPVIPTYFEGTQMFILAYKLKEELEKYEGIEVVVSRTKLEEDPTIFNRMKHAQRVKANMVLSLHSNAASNEIANGSEIFYSVKNKGIKTFTDKFIEKVSNIMSHNNRGSKTRMTSSGDDFYGIIRNAISNGISEVFIIEHGFHTNVKDTQWLLNDNNLYILAREEAKLIADFYGCKLKVVKAKTSDDIFREVLDLPEKWIIEKNKIIQEGKMNNNVRLFFDELIIKLYNTEPKK